MDNIQIKPKPERLYAGQSKSERISERREKFLEAGFNLFGTIGYQKTTLRNLCKEAKLIDRYFYESFESLEELLVAVDQRCLANLMTSIVTSIQNTSTDDFEQIVKTGLSAFFVAIQDRRIAKICYVEGIGMSDKVDQTHWQGHLVFADFILDIMANHYSLNTIPTGEQRLVAIGIGGAMNQIAVYWLMSDYLDAFDHIVNAAMRLVMGIVNQVHAR